MLQIVAYNQKNQKKYDKFVGKTFQMNDKIVIGENTDLVFKDDKIKTKIDSMEKDRIPNVEKNL